MADTSNHFRGLPESPHHISVGVVLLNKEGKIACHYYGEKGPGQRRYPPNFHTLLHESVEEHETLEQTVTRGLQEEFSAQGTLLRYVGSIVCHYSIRDVQIEKTVLYFLCQLTEISSIRDLSDPETVSEIRWMDIDDLIRIMEEQGAKWGSSTDESKILLDVQKYYISLKE